MTTRVATIAVTGLKTPSQWVSRLLVECANDAGITDLVSTSSSSVEWDGQFNNQKDYISFGGLTYGQTYYLRCGTACPVTGSITWSPVVGIQAGTGVAISLAYSTTTTVTSNGVRYRVTPNSPPSNVDHYEAIWNLTGNVPDVKSKPLWIGMTGQNPDFFVPAGISQFVNAWIRVINTDHIPQAWAAIPGEGVRPLQSQNGELDKWGSVPPTAVSSITYVASAAEIQWFWDGTNGSTPLVLYLADGSTQQIPLGALGVASLAASTAYYFYPYYYVPTGFLAFVETGIGTNDNALNASGSGTGAAYTSPNLGAASQQAQWAHMPISAGAISAQTTASGTTTGGTGGSGGGGGGGGGGCPRRGMVVMTKTRGVQKVENALVGEWIKTRVTESTPDGWTQLLRNDPNQEFEFIRIVSRVNGREEELEQSLMTPMPLARGEKMSTDLGLGDLLICDDEDHEYATIRRLEITEYDPGDERAEKRVFTCAPNPEFFCGQHSPVILTHNTIMSK